jgi:hypothetical protein
MGVGLGIKRVGRFYAGRVRRYWHPDRIRRKLRADLPVLGGIWSGFVFGFLWAGHPSDAVLFTIAGITVAIVWLGPPVRKWAEKPQQATGPAHGGTSAT